MPSPIAVAGANSSESMARFTAPRSRVGGAIIAVVPSILFTFTSNSLIQAFGGTSILIMVGVAMDTLSSLESQLKMHNYEGFFK